MSAENVSQQKGVRYYPIRVQRSALKKGRALEELRIVNLPPLFWGEEMDLSHAVDLHLGRKLLVTIAPPGRLFQKRGAGLAEIFSRPGSWLAILRDQFGQPRGQELELTPAKETGLLNMRLLRSTGRSIAEGQARLVGEAEIQFEMAIFAHARPGPPAALVRGRLDAAGEWRIEISFEKNFAPAKNLEQPARRRA